MPMIQPIKGDKVAINFYLPTPVGGGGNVAVSMLGEVDSFVPPDCGHGDSEGLAVRFEARPYPITTIIPAWKDNLRWESSSDRWVIKSAELQKPDDGSGSIPIRGARPGEPG